jgi:hypothetical protein
MAYEEDLVRTATVLDLRAACKVAGLGPKDLTKFTKHELCNLVYQGLKGRMRKEIVAQLEIERHHSLG